MKIFRSILVWLLAFALTAVSAVYQRLTGPSHPARGKVEIAGEIVSYKLLRSHDTGEDCPVSIRVTGEAVKGTIIWKRYKTGDKVTAVPMHRDGDLLIASLPMQPAAGKLEYEVMLQAGDEAVRLPEGGPAIIRYKGAVPRAVLIPHIIFMFAAMLFALRVLLAALGGGKVKWLSWTAFILLVIGGLFFGPVVQKYAFGVYWSGWPLGGDLTDNKTFLSVIAWLVALWFMRGPGGDRRGRWWAFGAALVLLSIYLIPHSMRGSELDYSTLPQETQPAVVDSLTVIDSSADQIESLPENLSHE